MKKRLPYLICFIVLTAIEVLIALFVNDSFVRPYLGDVIVVWVVYCFAQFLLGGRFSSCAVAAGVFLFAVFTEIMQGINIVELLGLGGSPFFRTLIGTHFDFKDLVCYAAGAVLLICIIFIKNRRKGDARTKQP